MSRHPYIPNSGGNQKFHRKEIVRPASLGTTAKLVDGLSWSVYEGDPAQHYASGSVPGWRVGSYNSPFTKSFFAGSFENGALKAIMEFRKPSTNEVIGIEASNIHALVVGIGPHVFVGDSVHRSLDCTIRIKMISTSFTGSTLTWNNAPAADASPAFTLTLNGPTGGHIGLVQSLVYLHIDGAQLDQTKTFYGLEMTVDTSFTDNGVPTQFIEPYGSWGTLYGILKHAP